MQAVFAENVSNGNLTRVKGWARVTYLGHAGSISSSFSSQVRWPCYTRTSTTHGQRRLRHPLEAAHTARAPTTEAPVHRASSALYLAVPGPQPLPPADDQRCSVGPPVKTCNLTGRVGGGGAHPPGAPPPPPPPPPPHPPGGGGPPPHPPPPPPPTARAHQNPIRALCVAAACTVVDGRHSPTLDALFHAHVQRREERGEQSGRHRRGMGKVRCPSADRRHHLPGGTATVLRPGPEVNNDRRGLEQRPVPSSHAPQTTEHADTRIRPRATSKSSESLTATCRHPLPLPIRYGRHASPASRASGGSVSSPV